MITEAIFDQRVTKLRANMVSRFAERRYAAGKKAGQVKVPKREIPFSRQELGLWLWRIVGLNVFLCVWCDSPIDILSLELDHKEPVERGGTLELDNLRPICHRCNMLKNKLNEQEFAGLVYLLRSPNMAFAKSNIESRLLQGGSLFRLGANKNRGKGKQAVPQQSFDMEAF